MLSMTVPRRRVLSSSSWQNCQVIPSYENKIQVLHVLIATERLQMISSKCKHCGPERQLKYSCVVFVLTCENLLANKSLGQVMTSHLSSKNQHDMHDIAWLSWLQLTSPSSGLKLTSSPRLIVPSPQSTTAELLLGIPSWDILSCCCFTSFHQAYTTLKWNRGCGTTARSKFSSKRLGQSHVINKDSKVDLPGLATPTGASLPNFEDWWT